MVHVHLVSSPRDWLVWARRSGIHPWVIDYISQRPGTLSQLDMLNEAMNGRSSKHPTAVVSRRLSGIGAATSQNGE